ncbi:MAG TPA: hypothetical protein VJM11_00420 [Nevskiaceae bacterium]|nr:hypothetical protein [Nevskiaceae bacterium]
MACCVLAALIISQVVLAWERCRAWIGLAPKRPVVAAADWRPGMTAVESAALVAAPSPLRRRLALVLALQLSLGAFLGLHWDHLGAELRTAGTLIGVVAPLPDPALCKVPDTRTSRLSNRLELAADPAP